MRTGTCQTEVMIAMMVVADQARAIRVNTVMIIRHINVIKAQTQTEMADPPVFTPVKHPVI
jgi:hypothetical protein